MRRPILESIGSHADGSDWLALVGAASRGSSIVHKPYSSTSAQNSVQLRTRRGDEVIHLIFAGLVRNHGVAAIRLTYCYGAYANPVVYSRLFSGTVARTASPEIETIVSVRPKRS